jgi:hypothetical protein
MVTRGQNGGTICTLLYDAENRLVKVHCATEMQRPFHFGNPKQPVAEHTFREDGQMVKADHRTIWQWKKAG